VIGLEVPHVHVHLIPLNAMADIQFTKKVNVTPEELTELANNIAANFV